LGTSETPQKGPNVNVVSVPADDSNDDQVTWDHVVELFDILY
jgi:hypothetical protein